MRFNHILILSILVLITAPALTFAQEQDGQGQDFFQKDFANQGFGDSADVAADRAESAAPATMVRPHLGPTDAIKKGVNVNDIIPKLRDKSKGGNKEGLEVQSIGLYVSGVDPEHLRKSIQTLVDFSIKHQISLERIQTLGANKLPKDSAFNHLMAAVWILDGQFSPLKKLPDVYQNLKSSPAWLINTKAGQYVLEAPSDPEAYFDEDGLFVPHTPTVVKEQPLINIE